MRILSQPWLQLSVQQVEFQRAGVISRDIQKAICSLPRLTSVQLFGGSASIPSAEALVLMTSAHTARVMVDDQKGAVHVASLIGALPRLQNLSLFFIRTTEILFWKKLTRLLLPNQFLQIRMLDLGMSDATRGSQAILSAFLANLTRLVELRVNPRTTTNLLRACILAGPGAMRALERVECRIEQGGDDSFAGKVSPQLVAQFLSRFPRVAEFHFGLGFGTNDGEVPDDEIGFVYRSFGGNPRVTIQHAPLLKVLPFQ